MKIISLQFMSDIPKAEITVITCTDTYNSISDSTQFYSYVP